MRNPDHESLTTADAEKVLARAATLDVALGDTMSVPRLRTIAEEVGLHPEAVQAALDEHAARDSASHSSVPAWVRLCVFGVPDRSAATRFYWLFVVGLLASPLWLTVGRARGRSGLLMLGSAAFCMFALWSTSAAIRWLDRHGWERLR